MPFVVKSIIVLFVDNACKFIDQFRRKLAYIHPAKRSRQPWGWEKNWSMGFHPDKC